MADKYAGYHDGPHDSRFVVFRIGNHWYWQSAGVQLTFGPFATAEIAYKHALGIPHTNTGD
jgi:hypothetical protein